MRKLTILLLTLLFLLPLASCKQDKPTQGGKLEDKTYSYYIGTKDNDFIATEGYELTPAAATNTVISSLNLDTTNVEYLYFGEVNFETIEKLGSVFEVIKTDAPNNTSTYIHIPSKNCGTNNLSAGTLYIPDYSVNPYADTYALASGSYYVVFVQYKNQVSGNLYGLALVVNDFIPEEPTPTPTPTPEVIPTQGGNTTVEGEINSLTEWSGSTSYTLAENIQDGVILHAYNWSFNTIKANLKDIAEAGYTTIQTSPAQQPKDYSASYGTGWATQWWKLYQPTSFAIQTTGWIGTEAELKSLCTEAHKYGIKIIVDVVTNHLAGASTAGSTTLYPDVKTNEKTIYGTSGTAKTGAALHSYTGSATDGNLQSIVQGTIGDYPDLDTSSEVVQSRVISLLKQYVDCGVDGFRFDAAKHIETPDDGAYASNYWPNVLTATTEYAKTTYTKSIYYYGEILNSVGNGRSVNSYTKHGLNITDNCYGNNVRTAMVTGSASSAIDSVQGQNKAGLKASQSVYWAESHDTYSNDEHESTNVSEANINKAWAIVAARKDATALYLARPVSMGNVGSKAFKNIEVASVNKFKTYFAGTDEDLYDTSTFACVERYNSSKAGIVVVNCAKANSAAISITTKHLKDGNYIDSVSGNTFVVKNHVLTGNIGSTGICVLGIDSSNTQPTVTLSNPGGAFSNTLTINFELLFANACYVTINGVTTKYTSNSSFTIGEGLEDGKTINVTVVASNGKYKTTTTYEFVKLPGITANSVVVKDVPANYYGTGKYLYAWVWPEGKDGRWVETTVVNGYAIFEINRTGSANDDSSFLLVYSIKSKDLMGWDYATSQTDDFKIEAGVIYSAPASAWK